MRRADLLAAAFEQRPLDDVLQLAHVAGKAVVVQPVDGGRGEPLALEGRIDLGGVPQRAAWFGSLLELLFARSQDACQ